jgi:pimeloyl-ACP methyl ester carboxylesterase
VKVPVIATALSAAVFGAAGGQTHAQIDVGGHHLDYVRAGSGNPVVVFETGLADSLNVWLPMLDSVSRYTTAIAYSRAGFGRSESGAPDHSVPHAVADLHELLHRIPVQFPLVLVARSYGSLIARLYISTYPGDVEGLVLVDGSHEQQVQRWGTIDSTYPAAFRAYYDSVLTRLAPGPEAAEIRETVRIQAAGGVEGMRPLPDFPIAVITSMKSDETSRYVNGTARGHEVWRSLHDEWFRRSRNGIHIVTTKSGHGIQADEPALVMQAIRFVLDRVHH